MNPTQILERLRVLCGIPVADNSHDEELERLFVIALAAARAYTHRWLYPVASFEETFQAVIDCKCSPCVNVVVSEVPVQEVTSATRDGATLDPATLRINARGAVYELNGALYYPLAPFSVFVLEYDAGYAELPADLAEALCQVAASAGSASVTAAGGTAQSEAVKKRTVFDVGAVEYANATGAFASGDLAAVPGIPPNALLGPWATVIDTYRDLSKTLGGDDCVHVLEQLTNPDPLPVEAPV